MYLKTIIIPQIHLELEERHKESKNEKGPFGSTWKRHRVSQHLASSPKGKKKTKEKDKENILGQHEGEMVASMPCVIPKRKSQEKMIMKKRRMKKQIKECTKREKDIKCTSWGENITHMKKKERKMLARNK